MIMLDNAKAILQEGNKFNPIVKRLLDSPSPTIRFWNALN
jgi:hypothetical protein